MRREAENPRLHFAGLEHTCKYGLPKMGPNNTIVKCCIYWFCGKCVEVDGIPDQVY